MSMILYVAVGGAIGATLRFLIGHSVESSGFPWSTFIVNMAGCALVAALAFSVGDVLSRNAIVFLFIGVFGAFTTMSTFTLETVTLFHDGEAMKAWGNVILNGGGCLLGAFVGRYLVLFF